MTLEKFKSSMTKNKGEIRENIQKQKDNLVTEVGYDFY